MQLLLPQRNKP